MSLAMSTFTVNARSVQKAAKKTANKAVGKAKGQLKSVQKKAKVSSGGAGDWYGPGRPGYLGALPASLLFGKSRQLCSHLPGPVGCAYSSTSFRNRRHEVANRLSGIRGCLLRCR